MQVRQAHALITIDQPSGGWANAQKVAWGQTHRKVGSLGWLLRVLAWVALESVYHGSVTNVLFSKMELKSTSSEPIGEWIFGQTEEGQAGERELVCYKAYALKSPGHDTKTGKRVASTCDKALAIHQRRFDQCKINYHWNGHFTSSVQLGIKKSLTFLWSQSPTGWPVPVNTVDCPTQLIWVSDIYLFNRQI